MERWPRSRTGQAGSLRWAVERPVPRAPVSIVLLAVGLGVLQARGGATRAAWPEPLAAVVRINAGGGALVDAEGRSWRADDTGVAGGSMSNVSVQVTSKTPEVDSTERYGDLRYTIPLDRPGSYVVRLHLTELYWHDVGQRIFDVAVEGEMVAPGVDILSLVPFGETYVLDLPVQVPDAVLDLALTPVRDNASVTAIEVLRVGGEVNRRAAPAPADPSSAPAPGDEPTPPPPAAAPAPSAAPPATGLGEPNGRAEPAPVTPGPGRSGRPVSALEYGAVGDGRTDDTVALQRALDSVPVGSALVLPAGRVFAHSDVLHLRRAGLHLTGPGALLATREERSSVWVEADDVVLDGGLLLRITPTTRRWDAWEQMRLRVLGVSRTVVREVTVDGSAAAGIYLGGARDFVLDRVTVVNTRADGIHMTSGTREGRVLSPVVRNSGDDGIAVVSYSQDGAPCSDITIRSPMVQGTTWGRGVSVVGGTDITYTDIRVERSAAAAVYIAGEGAPWFSAAPKRVKVTGGELVQSNTNRDVDHGAVVVLAGDKNRPEDVVVRGLTISDTRASASRSVGVITYGTPPKDVVIEDITVIGGASTAYQGNTTSGYSLLRWTVDGRRVPDRRF